MAKLAILSACLATALAICLMSGTAAKKPDQPRQLTVAGDEMTIGFPFSDSSMTQPMFHSADLGQIFSRKSGTTSAQRAFVLNETLEEKWVHKSDGVAATVNDEQLLLKNEEEALNFLHIDGSLQVQYGLISGEGKGFYQSLKSSDSMEFQVIQKSTVIKDQDWIDIGPIAQAISKGSAILNPGLDKPDKIDKFWNTNGEMYVKRLLRGGMARRIIRYRFNDAKTAQEMKAKVEGKMIQGVLDIGFEASFSMNNTHDSRNVDIEIQTSAVGGDPTIFKPTTDPKKAMQQLDRWKKSILKEKGHPTAVVKALLSPLNAQIVPAMQWSNWQLSAYFAHVKRAQKGLWEDELIRSRMVESLEKARDDMEVANFPLARRGKITDDIKEAQRQVEEQWLRSRDQDINDYFSQSATRIMREECCAWTATKSTEEKYRRLASHLTGRAMVPWRYSEGDSSWTMVWNGMASPTKDGPTQRIGYPEVVEVRDPSDDKHTVFKIYGKGWNLEHDRICDTEHKSCSGSKIVAFTQIEGSRELPKKLPSALLMRYHGTMRYKNGDVYEGPWADYKPDGEGGAMRYSSTALFVGTWRAGVRQGPGRYQDANGASFAGDWDNDMRQGQFKVKKNNHSTTLTLHFDKDVLVLRNMTLQQVQAEYAGNLPTSLYTHWKALDIAIPPIGARPGGNYSGSMKTGMRHGHGLMRFNDGTVMDQRWVDDMPAKDGAKTGVDWFSLYNELNATVARVQKGAGPRGPPGPPGGSGPRGRQGPRGYAGPPGPQEHIQCTLCVSCGGDWPHIAGGLDLDDLKKETQLAHGDDCAGFLDWVHADSIKDPNIDLCCK